MRLLVLILVIPVLLLGGLAGALPGPEPGSEDFSIVVYEADSRNIYDKLEFDTALGWDFGDREAYRCADVEFFDATGVLLFKAEIERTVNTTQINDRHGREQEGVIASDKPLFGEDDGCGQPAATGPLPFDGTNHFPHHTHMHFLDASGIEFAFLDLHRDDCARGYWTPGDEAGEAWLWWDEDGPEHNGHHDLDCGGGGQEPVPVAGLHIVELAPGITVCTHDDLEGSRCMVGTTPVPGPTPVPEPVPSPDPLPSVKGSPSGCGKCDDAKGKP